MLETGDALGIWFSSGEDKVFFENLYSREIWSISGPAKDVDWDNIVLNPRTYSDDVA